MSSHPVPATPVVLVMVLVEAVLPPSPVVVPPVVVPKLVVLVAPPAPVTLLAVITEPVVPVDVVEELDELVDVVPLVVDAAPVGLPVPVLLVTLVTLVVMVLLAMPPFVTLEEFVGPVAVKLVGPEVSLVLPGGVLSTTVAQPGAAPFKQVANSRPQNAIVPFVTRPERCAACFKVTLAGYFSQGT